MANHLGELFTNIANSIRGGLSDAGKMSPSAFPKKIDEIVGMMGESTEEIDYILDAINGEIIGETLYFITFMNGEELIQVPVYEGYDCDDPIATGLIEAPKRESTKYLMYTFAGWSFTDGGAVDESALLSVEENRTVYAVFAEEYIYVAKGSDTVDNKTLHWTLNPDYVLTVECNAYSCPEYNTSPPPWLAYREQISAFVSKGTCNEIGGGLLQQCTNLSSVTFLSPITLIQNNAFKGCTALTSITLPPKIRVIGHYAFCGASLVSITIPSETYVIQTGAFKCDTLESVVFERTDGWGYAGSSADFSSGNVTEVTQVQAADPSFAVDNFKRGSHIWRNSNLA